MDFDGHFRFGSHFELGHFENAHISKDVQYKMDMPKFMSFLQSVIFCHIRAPNAPASHHCTVRACKIRLFVSCFIEEIKQCITSHCFAFCSLTSPLPVCQICSLYPHNKLWTYMYYNVYWSQAVRLSFCPSVLSFCSFTHYMNSNRTIVQFCQSVLQIYAHYTEQNIFFTIMNSDQQW